MFVSGASPQVAEVGVGIGISMASLRRFWAVAARWNSSRAPFEFLPGRADIAVALGVIGKVLAREGAVGMLGFVEHWDVRLDPLLIDQPVQHLGHRRCRR